MKNSLHGNCGIFVQDKALLDVLNKAMGPQFAGQ
jgi:hypothetical protein